MRYSDNKKALQTFYSLKGLDKHFNQDSDYLEKAFAGIQKLWLDNFHEIKKVKYVMLAEAPLWGQIRKYIYNPDTANSQFFYRSDLGDILYKHISDKKEFINCCNKIGLIIVDISPFALNPSDTRINYRKLTPKEYRQLLISTIPTYLKKKFDFITTKKSSNIQVFFRYARVKNRFNDLIAQALIEKKIIRHMDEIGDISQNGGGIDKNKLGQILNKTARPDL